MKFLPAFIAPISLFGLTQEPWFPNIFEFQLDSSYVYSRYTQIQGSHPSFRGPSNDHQVFLELGLSPLSAWSFEAESEFAETPRTPFTLRSLAAQARMLLLDQVQGDPLNLDFGASLRGVFNHNLRDVSCPYHAEANLEFFTSLGKEWDKGDKWDSRLFGLGAIGQANRGYPWIRALFAFEKNVKDRHRYRLYAQSYSGLGPEHRVNPKHFFGYAKIGHQSIDAGLAYTYLLDYWGSFTLGYAHRLFARSFPEQVNFVNFTYHLPFWPF